MYFFKRCGWEVQFLEADLKTPLPRKLTFTDPENIRELSKRGEHGAIQTYRKCSGKFFGASGECGPFCLIQFKPPESITA